MNEYKLIIECLKKYKSNEKVKISQKNNYAIEKIKDICINNKILTIVSRTLLISKDRFLIKDGLYLYLNNELSYYSKKKEIIKLLTILEENNIKYAIVKGYPLANNNYREPFVRTSCDLDLLIEPCNLMKVKKILLSEGYQLELTEIDKQKNNRKKEIYYSLYTHSLPPYKKIVNNNYIEIDINYKVAINDEKAIDSSVFLRNITKQKILDFDGYVLDNTYHYLYIIIHHFREYSSIYHIYNRQDINLQKLCDLYYFDKNSIDIELFLSLIKELNIQFEVSIILTLLYKVFKDNFTYKILNAIGEKELTKEETYSIEIDIEEIFTNRNRYEYIKPLLTDKERKKLEIITDYI